MPQQSGQYGQRFNKSGPMGSGEQSMTSMKLMLLAKSIEGLPYLFRIGDIIRVHRCNVSDYKNELNLTGNVYVSTSWVVFSGNPDFHHRYDCSPEVLEKRAEAIPGFIRLLDQYQEEQLIEEQKMEELRFELDEVYENICDKPVSQFKKVFFDSCKLPEKRYTPIMSSHQTYAFNDSEKQVIDRLRDWSSEYFKQTYIFGSDTEMNMQEFSSGKDGTTYYKDFDILGKLNEVEWIDDQFCNIYVKDLAGKVYTLRINNKRVRIPQKGEIIRVRGVKPMKQNYFVGTSKDPIKLDINFYSNILHIPYYFKQAV